MYCFIGLLSNVLKHYTNDYFTFRFLRLNVPFTQHNNYKYYMNFLETDHS